MISSLSRPFKLQAPYHPTGDQPEAIRTLVENLKQERTHQVLLGVTGSGKTFSIANVIEQVQRPTLVLAHNKTLAAQLFSEFREFFPDNSVQYFVSYYDYYQPEAYVPMTDTYIAKESDINQEIEKFRHASTHALLTRRDVIIVASVSCIYGLGSPETYRQANFPVKQGAMMSRTELTRRLIEMQYERNDLELRRGKFAVRGDTIVIYPAYEDFQVRISQFGDEIEKIDLLEPIEQKVVYTVPDVELFPAKHYIVEDTGQEAVLKEIEADMHKEVQAFMDQGMLVEAQRLKQRVTYDIEMIRETGSVNGIENYSRYFDRRPAGSAPSVLLDYFPDDFLLVIDESHITIPQISGMYNGDQARKQTLVDYGFRLKAAKDNRPLTFNEFEERIGQRIFVSATPGNFEMDRVKTESQAVRLQTGSQPNLIAEQLIRPTGIPDPAIEVRPVEGQIGNLMEEINARIAKNERTLVITLTKRMAEDVSEFLSEKGIKVQYLHADVKTVERSQILQDLRKGIYDVVVGINLLREGIDLPEVSLLAILDADKEGFLRSETSLIQTIGRTARHPEGLVIMYADRMTGSMERAIAETNRRRAIQVEYNEKHGIVPQVMVKPIVETLPLSSQEEEEALIRERKRLTPVQRRQHIERLRAEMEEAAYQLRFERAAELRDEIRLLEED